LIRPPVADARAYLGANATLFVEVRRGGQAGRVQDRSV